MRPSARVGSLAAVFYFTLGSAQAQTAGGFALDRFNPSERGSDWFAADSLDLRGGARPAVGLVGDYAYRPLVIYNTDGSSRLALVENSLVVHVGAALNLWERLRVGIDLPVAAWQSGQGGTSNGITYPAGNSSGVGDVRLGADLRLFGIYGEAATAAIGVQAFLPSGSRSSYLGDGSVRLLPRAQIAGDLGPFAYAVNAGFVFHSQDDSFGPYARGSEVVFGASAGFRLADRKLLIGPEVYGATVATKSDAVFAKRQTALEAVLGGHYTVARDWRIGLGAGPGLTRGFGEPVVRVLAAIEWFPAIPEKEVPPAEAPEPPPPPPDRDKDGIIDGEDACPNEPGVKTDDPKTNGCPPPPPDRDKDGIVDGEDACPDTPGVKTEDPKTNGCPPDPDRDKDGIPNEDDACPDAPGPKNADPKKNGCPMAYVKDKQIQILQQVKFATNSAAIVPGKESLDVLNAVLGVINTHPEIAHLRIEGHTDNKGSAAYNKTLSGQRAGSVVRWLVQRGIDKSRLSSTGWGLEKPVDTNDTPEGRTNNRRVEFHIEGEDEK